MIALFVLILLECAGAQQLLPVHFSDSKKMTAEQFRKIPDDPYSDPVVDIPEVRPEQLRPTTPDNTYYDFHLARDRYKYLQDNKMTEKITQEDSDQRAHMWIDFQKLHDHLIQEQAKPWATTRKPQRNLGHSARPAPKFNQKIYQQKLDEFQPQKFMLNSEDIFPKVNTNYSIVWTTCDEFRDPSQLFEPADFINFDWVPFYSWSYENGIIASVHRFTTPTMRQVHEYYTKYSAYLNHTVDWNKPKLYFEHDLGEHAALLIAVDETGLYFCINNSPISQFVQRNNIILKTITVRLKVVGDYLAMMHCEWNQAVIMARDGHEPRTNKEKREASKILKFKGKGRPVARDVNFEKERQRIRDEESKYAETRVMNPVGPAFGDRPIGRNNRNKENLGPVFDDLIPGGPV